MNEPELVRQASKGDNRAIAALYDRHAARVYTVVRRLAGEDALAEDWAQETWLRAIRGLPDFRGDAAFGTWIHRIAVNVALNQRRTEQRRDGRDAALAAPVDCQPGKPLLRWRLEQALDNLPEGMRRVLVLHDVEGLTHNEIASLLGVEPGTSKSQLFKARARMRTLLRSRTATVIGERICHS